MEYFELAMQGNLWQISISGRAVSTNQRKSFAALAESAFCEVVAQGSPQGSDKVVLMHNRLKRDHHARDCSTGPCHACQSRHHTLLHYRQSVQKPQVQVI